MSHSPKLRSDAAAAKRTAGPRDDARARALVLAHGWNATAYQILNPGISHWFSPAGDAVAGYVAVAGYWVVAGAPTCAESILPRVVDELGAAAAATGHRVCYFGAGERLERLLVARGWSAASLGAQPSWSPADWPAVPARRASLRAQLNRARNKGVTVMEWTSVDDRAREALERCLDEWLARRPMPALHFLVEPDTLGRLDDRRLFVARRGSNVVGFLLASPVPARRGWLVEQIIRGAGAPNGTAELLFDAAMRALAESGAAYVTLGLAPLSRHAGFDQRRMPGWLRLLLGWMRAHGRRFYNFEGLDHFKAKLGPSEWEDIVALAEGPRFPPRALWAVAAAFSQGPPVGLIARALGRAARQEWRWMRRAVRSWRRTDG